MDEGGGRYQWACDYETLNSGRWFEMISKPCREDEFFSTFGKMFFFIYTWFIHVVDLLSRAVAGHGRERLTRHEQWRLRRWHHGSRTLVADYGTMRCSVET